MTVAAPDDPNRPKPPPPKRAVALRNIKSGDLVVLFRKIEGQDKVIVSSRDGDDVIVVVDCGQVRFDAHIYHSEIKGRLSEFNKVPVTLSRLRYLIEMAGPETAERQMLRASAQAQLMELYEQDQVTFDGDASWFLNPLWDPQA